MTTRHYSLAFFYGLLLQTAVLLAAPTTLDVSQVAEPVNGEVCFSPEENCHTKVIRFIRSAKKSLDLAIYDLTHVQLAHELLVASRRIPVRIVADRRQSKGKHSLISLLQKGEVPLRWGTQRGIMHNKFLIVDGEKVQTGSFNYTHGAVEKNRENQIYVFDPGTVARFSAEFNRLWSAGRPATAQRIARHR